MWGIVIIALGIMCEVGESNGSVYGRSEQGHQGVVVKNSGVKCMLYPQVILVFIESLAGISGFQQKKEIRRVRSGGRRLTDPCRQHMWRPGVLAISAGPARKGRCHGAGWRIVRTRGRAGSSGGW